MIKDGNSFIHDYGVVANENTNLSLPHLYSYGDRVIHHEYGSAVVEKDSIRPLDADKGVILYLHNGTTHASGFTYDILLSVYKDQKVHVLPEEVKKFNFMRFLFWRSPSGELMHGNNNAIGQFARYAFFLFLSIFGITMLKYSMGFIALTIGCALVIATMLYHVWLNYTGKKV